MKVQEKFNKKTAKWLDTSGRFVRGGLLYGGVCVEFYEKDGERRTLAVDMAPLEALKLAKEMVDVATARLEWEAQMRVKGHGNG